MAEFVSAVVGLVVVGVQVGDQIRGFIETLKEAPDELLDLSQEIVQLNAALTKLKQDEKGGLLEDDCLNYLNEDGQKILLEVEVFVQELRRPNSEGFRRMKWAVKKEKAKKLRERIQRLRDRMIPTKVDILG